MVSGGGVHCTDVLRRDEAQLWRGCDKWRGVTVQTSCRDGAQLRTACDKWRGRRSLYRRIVVVEHT